MSEDKEGEMIFLDDLHAIDKGVLICNNGNYATYPINLTSALECCPICETLLPAGALRGPQKRKLNPKTQPCQHVVKKESIFCPMKGKDIWVGMGAACEICPECGVYL